MQNSFPVVFCKNVVYMAAMNLRLCAIHVQERLLAAFRAAGCEVLGLWPEPGATLDLPEELAARGFTPDLVFQQELLGPRVLLRGLEAVPAVRAFWAIDPHLNAFWQAPYARLFDVLLSTQRRWTRELCACGAGPAVHLPWYAPDRPFTPFAARARDAGFVGRLGPTRPARAWLVTLMNRLLPCRVEARDDLSFEAMLDFCQGTRLAPNESITGEINFRLFEAAGCGCVVLAQALGPLGAEQAELFEPGREILVCADSLELAENVRLLLNRPRLAEAMGRAAWERARRDHQPAARARSILAAMTSAPRTAATADSERWLALARAALLEAGRLPLEKHAGVARDLAALPGQDAAVLAARLRTAHARADAGEAERLLERLRTDAGPTAAGPEALAPLLAGSMLALRLALAPGEGAALALAGELARRAGVAPPQEPCAPERLLQAWAVRLDAAGLEARGGFPFDPGRHLPGSAAECLFWARALAPDDLEILGGLAEGLGRNGAEALRLGVLSELGLRARADWLPGLELGLCDLRLFRPGEGLDELACAGRLAADQGAADAFAAALAARDPSGRIRRALQAAAPQPTTHR